MYKKLGGGDKSEHMCPRSHKVFEHRTHGRTKYIQPLSSIINLMYICIYIYIHKLNVNMLLFVVCILDTFIFIYLVFLSFSRAQFRNCKKKAWLNVTYLCLRPILINTYNYITYSCNK